MTKRSKAIKKMVSLRNILIYRHHQMMLNMTKKIKWT